MITEKQLRVLKLLAGGLRSKEIGKELKLSNRTIDDHLYKLRKIMGAKSSANLVFVACKQGVI